MITQGFLSGLVEVACGLDLELLRCEDVIEPAPELLAFSTEHPAISLSCLAAVDRPVGIPDA